MVSTNLSRHWWLYRCLFALVRPFAKSLQQAASSVVFASFSPDLDDSWGVYVNNCFPTEPSEAALDPKLRQKYWKLTFELLRDKLRQIDTKTVKDLELV